MHRLDDAAAQFREALRGNSEMVEAHINLGSILQKEGRLQEAMSHYRQAQRIKPDSAEALTNLGSALQKEGRTEEAKEHYLAALRLNPGLLETRTNLGTAWHEQGRYEEALTAYDEVLRLQADFGPARWSRALVWLVQGDFERGWPDYEWRWTQFDGPLRAFPQPRWNGADLGGQPILIHAEQGLGDTLQFIRYVPMVHERGGKVIVECQPALAQLVATVSGVETVVSHGSAWPAFAVHAPLLSLPRIFQTSLSTIPAVVPYVHVTAELVAQWQSRLAEVAPPAVHGGRCLRIGIAWQGNPKYVSDRKRSIPLSQFEPLSNVPGVTLISLQRGAGTEQLQSVAGRWRVIDMENSLGNDPESLLNLAAIIKNLDLVITCDTAIAHLAGALAAPVWVALPHIPDWRWLLQREDSPWYPSMRLFRQSCQGRWDDVFTRMESELQAKSSSLGHSGESDEVVRER
jgi:hypothetical protein